MADAVEPEELTRSHSSARRLPRWSSFPPQSSASGVPASSLSLSSILSITGQSKTLRRLFSFGSRLRRSLLRPGYSFLFESLSILAFSLSWLYREQLHETTNASAGPAVFAWLCFGFSIADALVLLHVVLRLSSRDVPGPRSAMAARALSWTLLSLLMVQYIFFQGRIYQGPAEGASQFGDAASVALSISGLWTIVFVGPPLHFCCSNLRILGPTLCSVSCNLPPLLLFVVQVVVIAIDIVALSLNLRVIYYATVISATSLALLALLYTSSYRTPEGNFLAQAPLVALIVGAALEAGAVTSRAVAIPVVLLAYFLWCPIAHFAFSRNYYLATRYAHNVLGNHTAAFALDATILASEANPAMACLALVNVVRRRLSMRFLQSLRPTRTTLVSSVEEAKRLRDLAEAALDAFPRSHFLAVQFCTLCRDLNLHSPLRIAWLKAGNIRRLLLTRGALSLFDLSFAYECQDLVEEQARTLETLEERRAEVLGRLPVVLARSTIAEVDRLRRRIVVLTAYMFREIGLKTSLADSPEGMVEFLQQQHRQRQTRRRWSPWRLSGFSSARASTSSIEDPIWGILFQIIQLESRGRSYLSQLVKSSTTTPEVLRCRARWSSDVDTDEEKAQWFLDEAEFLEDYLSTSSADRFRALREHRRQSYARCTAAAGAVTERGLSNPPPASVTGDSSVTTATPRDHTDGPEAEGEIISQDQTALSAESSRLRELRTAISKRRSSTMWSIQLASITTLLICCGIIIALFVVSRSLIQPPVTNQSFIDGTSATSVLSSTAITAPLEAASRIRRAVATDALLARTLVWKNYLLPDEMAFYRALYPTVLAAYTTFYSVILVQSETIEISLYFETNMTVKSQFVPRTSVTASAATLLSDLFVWFPSTMRAGELAQSYLSDLQTESSCVTNSQFVDTSFYIDDGFVFSKPNGTCAQTILQDWFNALSTVWMVFDGAVPLYRSATLDYVGDLVVVITVLAVLAFAAELLLLLLVLLPSMYRSFRDQERMVDLLFSVDRRHLKKRQEQLMSKVRAEEGALEANDSPIQPTGAGQDQVDLTPRTEVLAATDGTDEDVEEHPVAASNRRQSVTTPSSRPLRRSTSSLDQQTFLRPSRRSLQRKMFWLALFMTLAVLVIMAYTQVFTILLAIYISYAKRTAFEVQYITDTTALFIRGVAAALELYPISQPSLIEIALPTYPNATLPRIYSLAAIQFAQRGMQSWSYLIDGDGQNTNGIRSLSSEINDAMFSPEYLSSEAIFPDPYGRSLASDLESVYDAINLFANVASAGTNNNVFSLYRPLLQPFVLSIIPAKFDKLRSAFASYYSDRTNTLSTVAVYFFGFQFLLLPLLYWFCFHRVLRTIERSETRLRKTMCMLDLPSIESSSELVNFMRFGTLDQTRMREHLFQSRAQRDRAAQMSSEQQPSISAASTLAETVGRASNLRWYLRQMPYALLELRRPDLTVMDLNSSATKMFGTREYNALGSPISCYFLNDSGFFSLMRYLNQDAATMTATRRTFHVFGLRSLSLEGPSAISPQTLSATAAGSVQRSTPSPRLNTPSGSSIGDRSSIFPCVVSVIPSMGTAATAEDVASIGLSIQDATDDGRQKNLLECEKKRSNDLLLNMLPAPVAERLKRNEGPLAFLSKGVTVVFVDVLNFSKLCRERAQDGPAIIINLLDELFTQFDEAAEHRKVYKLKITNSIWMGVANLLEGLAQSRQQEKKTKIDVQKGALSGVRFCLDAIHIANHFGLHVMCGVHVGEVVSGVVSRTRYSYDAFGDSVNLAARLQQTCPYLDAVHISQEAHDLVHEWLECGEMESFLKGIGTIKSYVVEKLRDAAESGPSPTAAETTSAAPEQSLQLE